jgi:FkbM family methyltransferase
MLATVRRTAKRWLYGYTPGFAGRFPYFGCQVYFPRGSILFRAACEQGIFEADNVTLLCGLAEPESTLFDVGANIGLVAVPVLRQCPKVQVVSFEPSPSTLPYLRRTAAGSGFGERWQIVDKGVGLEPGECDFHTARLGDDAFEGRQATGRCPSAQVVRVPMTTLDAEWDALGRPRVSVVKLDIEGGEIDALRGAMALLAGSRPAVLLEWNATNLRPYGVAAVELLHFASRTGYRVHTVPELAVVDGTVLLRAAMSRGESFLLVPAD